MHYLKGCKLPHEIRNTLDKLSTPISIVTKASQVKLSTWLVAAKHQYIEWIFFPWFLTFFSLFFLKTFAETGKTELHDQNA